MVCTVWKSETLPENNWVFQADGKVSLGGKDECQFEDECSYWGTETNVAAEQHQENAQGHFSVHQQAPKPSRPTSANRDRGHHS